MPSHASPPWWSVVIEKEGKQETRTFEGRLGDLAWYVRYLKSQGFRVVSKTKTIV